MSSSGAVKIPFYLSRVFMLMSSWLLTLILTFWNRKYMHYCLYFSFITLYPSFITFLWQAFCDKWPLELHYFAVSKMNKKSSVLCRNFISIYKINRTLHGRAGIRILSSSAESISHEWAKRTSERYFQHSKIKFVSPRSHVISSIYSFRVARRMGLIVPFAPFLIFHCVFIAFDKVCITQ